MFRRLMLLAALLVAASAARAPEPVVTVFTAASLSAATESIARAYEASHAGVRVRVVAAGSQQLVAQLEQGAMADVFLSADAIWMERLAARGDVATAPRVLAHNSLVLIVPRAGHARIGAVRDLASVGARLVLGAPEVPIGRYARMLLTRAASGPEELARILTNVVSEEESVAGVLAKVQLGEADAGIVYRSDVTTQAARRVRVVPVPEAAQVRTSASIAPLRRSHHPAHAHAFVAWALSASGQRLLRSHGFVPAGPR